MKGKNSIILNLVLVIFLLLINSSITLNLNPVGNESTTLKSKSQPGSLYLQTSMKVWKQEAEAAPAETAAEGEAETPAEPAAEAEAVEGEPAAEATAEPAAEGDAAATESAEDKKAADEKTEALLEESNERLEELEATLANQQQTVEQVRGLLDDVEDLSHQISSTKTSNEEIKQSVDDIKDYFQDLDFKIQAQGIETNYKLNQINNKLAKQLSTQLSLHLYSLNNVVHNVLDDLKRINRKIDQIKKIIPDTTSSCAALTDCQACTTNTGCGWCSMTQSCLAGNAEGALDGSCSFFEYGKCSAPDCTSLKTCTDCIKDATCGWCGNSVDPVCMTKDDGETECNEDRFIHLWKTINVCPSLTDDNKIAKILKLVEKAENGIVLTDPEEIRRKREELNVYETERNKKKADLEDLTRAVDLTQAQMKQLEKEEESGEISDKVLKDNKESI
jgi:vacuolar-type H+-ATPase subunit I/STV1